MKLKKWSGLFIAIMILLVTGCSEAADFSVSTTAKGIELKNNGKKEVRGILCRAYYDTEEVSHFYQKSIDVIAAGETITINKSELLDTEKKAFAESKKVKQVRVVKAKDPSKCLYTWFYTPDYQDPAGYTFYSKDSADLYLHFYKYTGDNVVSSSGPKAIYGFTSGKYHMDNGKIILSLDGNDDLGVSRVHFDWSGILEDDVLILKLESEKPAGALAMLDRRVLYKVEATDNNPPNKQEIEKFSNYEDNLLLTIAQTFTEEEEIKRYAEIYHYDEYQKVKDDEFLWHDKRLEYLQEFQDKVSKIPTDYTMRFDWTLGDYNFNSEEFKISFKYSNDISIVSSYATYSYLEMADRKDVNLAVLEKKYPFITVSVPLVAKGSFFGSITYDRLEGGLPMEKSAAQEFLASRKQDDGSTDKSVVCVVAYHVDTDYKSKNRYTGLPLGGDVVGEIKKVTFYDDENNMNKLSGKK